MAYLIPALHSLLLTRNYYRTLDTYSQWRRLLSLSTFHGTRLYQDNYVCHLLTSTEKS